MAKKQLPKEAIQLIAKSDYSILETLRNIDRLGKGTLAGVQIIGGLQKHGLEGFKTEDLQQVI